MCEMKQIILLAVVTFTLIGCASVPMGSPQENARLKTFSPMPEDKAGIYVYRNETFGAAVKMDVEIDGRHIGQTAAETYLYKEVTPGTHTVTSRAENDDSVVVDAKQGTLSYVWQEVKMGLLYARTKLHLVSDSEGRKGVLESNLAHTQ